MKTERNKQGQEMEAMCDSRSKKYMIKISFIILKIQDFTKDTMLDLKMRLFFFSNSGFEPLTSTSKHKTKLSSLLFSCVMG